MTTMQGEKQNYIQMSAGDSLLINMAARGVEVINFGAGTVWVSWSHEAAINDPQSTPVLPNASWTFADPGKSGRFPVFMYADGACNVSVNWQASINLSGA